MSYLATHEATSLESFEISENYNKGNTAGLLPSPAASI